MSTIVFSHANSFPAATYKVLFKSLRARGFSVKAVDKYGHDPRYPVSNNWPNVVQQLVDFATPIVEKAGEPVWLVGHSLGGLLECDGGGAPARSDQRCGVDRLPLGGRLALAYGGLGQNHPTRGVDIAGRGEPETA